MITWTLVVATIMWHAEVHEVRGIATEAACKALAKDLNSLKDTNGTLHHRAWCIPVTR